MEVRAVLKIVGVVWSEHLKHNSMGGELHFCCLKVTRGPSAYFHNAKQRHIWSKVSAQLTAHSMLRRDGTEMVSTINEVDTTDERSLKPFET
jgi:hypothetical protein